MAFICLCVISIRQIGIYRFICAIHGFAGCSFLVAAQETNQRKRLGDALAAKSFFTADLNEPGEPDFEPPSPRPPPGPRLKTGYDRFCGGYTGGYGLNCGCQIQILSTTSGLPTSAGRGT